MSNISFIVPAFNASATIIESLESIYPENFTKGDEIIVVDDGSTDNTVKLVSDWNFGKGVVWLYSHENNRGGGAARNTAVERARNQLVFCLDSDNLLFPGSIEPLKQFLINENHDVACFGKISFFKHQKSNVTHEWQFKTEYDFQDILRYGQSPAGSGNYLYTKRSWEKTRGYPEYARALDAWGFGLKQVANGFHIHSLQGFSYLHRYGLESYYVRECNYRSIDAVRILLEFHDRIDPRDLQRILNTDMYSWFEILDEHPVALKGNRLVTNISSVNRIKRGIKKILKNLGK